MAVIPKTFLTKCCGRCGGTGSYSFNLMDGDRCYRCGGSGRVIVLPKGQKKIVPTCTNYKLAKAGDILKHGPVLYLVEEIRWTRLRYTAARGWTNQQLRLSRFLDGKTLYMTRLYEKITLLSSLTYGERREIREAIEPSPEMVGQLFLEAGD